MAELPKDEAIVEALNSFQGLHKSVNNNKKTDLLYSRQAGKMSALERLFCLINEGIKINPEEYKISFVKIILLGFFILGLLSNSLWAISNISSPNKSAYSIQYLPINGTASKDSKKVEVQIHQIESNTYWDGKCWVGTSNWLLCSGTTSWFYNISTYFSDNLSYNIKPRSTDISGNVEAPSNGITFMIDTSPPYSYFTLPEYNNKTYSDMPKIYGQAADSKSGVAMVMVRLKDITDGTYWDGKGWGTNEIWIRADGAYSFSVPVSIWKVNHQYNAVSQAVDFAQLEEGLNSGYSFYIESALKLSTKTAKQIYIYGEPITVEINFENDSQSTQILELPSSKLYDFTIDSIYRYSDTKTFTQSKTQFSFQPGKTVYSEKIDKIIPKGQHTLTAEIPPFTSKYVFDVISDTTAPTIALQEVADGQYKYFSIPVAAKITDNAELQTVTLHSGNNSWQMIKTTDELWTSSIPSDCNTSSNLSYYIEAVDLSGNKTTTDTKIISTKEIPLPDAEEISVIPQTDNTYLIGLKNFADLSGIYYRVYYDRGTGAIDYSSPVGVIDEKNQTVTTQKLQPSTDYKFVIVPVIESLSDTIAEINAAAFPAPQILVKTLPPAQESVLSGGGGRIIIIKIPAGTGTGGDNDISISQPTEEIREKIISERPAETSCVSEPLTVTSKKVAATGQIIISLKFFITLPYIDDNQDGFLDGTSIKETTLVILRYDEIEKKWLGGFETTINTQKNECYAYVDRFGTYAIFSALQIYPFPVERLSGEATEKQQAKINWVTSLSASSEMYNVYYEKEFYYEKIYTAGYRIYWDKGTGTIDYSRPIVELKSPTSSWISQQLAVGLYKFGVRVVDIENTEEQNINYVVVNIGKTGSASAGIRIPKDGQRLRGNAVTIIADATPDTTAVLFQYKDTDGDWKNISTIDKKPPYAVYWNLSSLPNGKYLIRAVANDEYDLTDVNPAHTTVYIDDVNWDISEDGNPSVDPNSQHRKQEKIMESSETVVMTADGTAAVVPEGVAEKDSVLEIKTIQPEALPSLNSSLEPIGVFREYNFSDGKTQFEKEITIFIPYPDENNDGIVDGTDKKTESLEIYYLDEKNNEWKKADNRSGLGDGTNPGNGDGRDNSKNDGTDNPNNKNNTKNGSTILKYGLLSSKVISAKVNHFTKFGIFAKAPRINLENVSVYPNPLKWPAQTITFDGLTANIKIKIYTVAGRLADEFETTTDGKYNWNPVDLASGIYIYYIEDKSRGEFIRPKKGKIGIIR